MAIYLVGLAVAFLMAMVIIARGAQLYKVAKRHPELRKSALIMVSLKLAPEILTAVGTTALTFAVAY